jgi:RNA polymerase sigma-70 factor (ECF subfamily)
MQETDFSWLASAQNGNSEAFTQLVETFQRPVFNLCYRMLGDAAEAEDAAQETFMRAYRSIKHYDNSRPFPTWLMSISAHFCIDQIRKRRMALVPLEEMGYAEPPDNSPGPEQSLSRSEEQRMVRGLLNQLSPVDRAAVVMYYWSDFSYEEIGSALSLTESAVKSRLHRARRDMAKSMIDQREQAQSIMRSAHGEQSPAY